MGDTEVNADAQARLVFLGAFAALLSIQITKIAKNLFKSDNARLSIFHYL